MSSIDPEAELRQRSDELSPHQRAFAMVLRFWMAMSTPASIALALIVAIAVARGPGHVDGTILLLTYLGIGMPASIGLTLAQRTARRAIARRILAQLDAPVRGAISGRESTTTFAATQTDESARE